MRNSLLAILILMTSLTSFASSKVITLTCAFDYMSAETFSFQIKDLSEDHEMLLPEDYGNTNIVLMNQAKPFSTISKRGAITHLVNVLNKASLERHQEGDPQTLREKDNNIEIYGYQTGYRSIALILTGASNYTKGVVEYDYENGYDINDAVTCTRK